LLAKIIANSVVSLKGATIFCTLLPC